jgi:hypothetical protein
MSKIEPLSKELESAAVDAVKEAAALSAAGEEPSEALAKVATRHKFTPPLVERVVEAFNAHPQYCAF